MTNHFNGSWKDLERKFTPIVSEYLIQHSEMIRMLLKPQNPVYDNSEEERELQKQGIDGRLVPTGGWDYKFRSNSFYDPENLDLFIEVKNSRDESGWIYNKKAKLIIYCWMNDDEDDIVDAIIINRARFVEWFAWHEKRFETKNGDCSVGRIVPVDEIPSEAIEVATELSEGQRE